MHLRQVDEALRTEVAGDGGAFAGLWIDAWNSHDLARIGSHYREDVVFRSPVAARLEPGSGGVLRGRDRLLEYFAKALDRSPELHFDHLATLHGVEGGIAIVYRNHRGFLVIETVHLEGGKVACASVYYSTPNSTRTDA